MRIANKTLHKIVRDLIGNLRNVEPMDPAFFIATATAGEHQAARTKHRKNGAFHRKN